MNLAHRVGARAAGKKTASASEPARVDATASTVPIEQAPQPEYARAGAVPHFASMR